MGRYTKLLADHLPGPLAFLVLLVRHPLWVLQCVWFGFRHRSVVASWNVKRRVCDECAEQGICDRHHEELLRLIEADVGFVPVEVWP